MAHFAEYIHREIYQLHQSDKFSFFEQAHKGYIFVVLHRVQILVSVAGYTLVAEILISRICVEVYCQIFIYEIRSDYPDFSARTAAEISAYLFDYILFHRMYLLMVLV